MNHEMAVCGAISIPHLHPTNVPEFGLNVMKEFYTLNRTGDLVALIDERFKHKNKAVWNVLFNSNNILHNTMSVFSCVVIILLKKKKK